MRGKNRIKGIILDAGATKAYRVLRARLSPLGFEVRVNPPGLPDEILDRFRIKGYVIISTDKDALRYGWVYIPYSYVVKKSAKDLSTHILKVLFRGR